MYTNKNINFNINKLKNLEILPKDSILNNYIKNCGEEEVWMYEGDLELDSLKLDYIENEINPILIIIKGNLKVQNNIVNENTDSGINLMILGNLEANNIEVGGQEIYVSGNANISGVYNGIYNHGILKVKGDISAYVLINSDYTFEVEGSYNCRYIFEDSSIFTSEGLELLKKLFIDEAFYFDLFDNQMAFGGVGKILLENRYPFKKKVL